MDDESTEASSVDSPAVDGPACELVWPSPDFAESVDQGLQLIKTMKEVGITFSDPASYAALLNSCAKASGPDSPQYAKHALSILETMGQNGVEANSEAYGHTIEACARAELLFRAVDLLRLMVKTGLEPSRSLFDLVLDTSIRQALYGSSVAVEQGVVVLGMMKEVRIQGSGFRIQD